MTLTTTGTKNAADQHHPRRVEDRQVSPARRLHLAVAAGDVTQIDTYLQSDARCVGMWRDGVTPLERAATQGHRDAVACLLRHGAIPVRDSAGTSRGALGRAAAAGHIDVVQTLLEVGSAPRFELLQFLDGPGLSKVPLQAVESLINVSKHLPDAVGLKALGGVAGAAFVRRVVIESKQASHESKMWVAKDLGDPVLMYTLAKAAKENEIPHSGFLSELSGPCAAACYRAWLPEKIPYNFDASTMAIYRGKHNRVTWLAQRVEDARQRYVQCLARETDNERPALLSSIWETLVFYWNSASTQDASPDSKPLITAETQLDAKTMKACRRRDVTKRAEEEHMSLIYRQLDAEMASREDTAIYPPIKK